MKDCVVVISGVITNLKLVVLYYFHIFHVYVVMRLIQEFCLTDQVPFDKNNDNNTAPYSISLR